MIKYNVIKYNNVRLIIYLGYQYLGTLIIILFCTSCTTVISSTQKAPSLTPEHFKTFYPSKEPAKAKLLERLRSLHKLKKLDQTSEKNALNIISWQLENGGFGLHDIEPYSQVWDGQKTRSVWMKNGIDIANFDDGATVSELRFLAKAYTHIINEKTKQAIQSSIHNGIEFILNAQYPDGGWRQVWPSVYPTDPKKSKRYYANYTTLNDHAMIRNMVLLSDILSEVAPFSSKLTQSIDRIKIIHSLLAAKEHLLKAQIRANSELTIWPAQFDPISFEPMPARPYELISKSSRESVGVLSYLLNWPLDEPKINAAIMAGVNWFKKNEINNLELHNGELINSPNKKFWYRFYEIDSNKPFFTGRDGIKRYKLSEIEEERRKGYSWGDNWAEKLLKAVE